MVIRVEGSNDRFYLESIRIAHLILASEFLFELEHAWIIQDSLNSNQFEDHRDPPESSSTLNLTRSVSVFFKKIIFGLFELYLKYGYSLVKYREKIEVAILGALI